MEYTINGLLEETGCEWCGYLLYTGDTAIMTADEKVVCGIGCARKLERSDAPNNGKE